MEPFLLSKCNSIQHLVKEIPSAQVDQVSIHSGCIFSKNALFIALRGRLYDGHDFVPDSYTKGARYAIVEESYTPPKDQKTPILLRVANPLKTLQELALSYRSQFSCQVIAIVGTSGKTILKDLLGKILSTHYTTFCSPESYNSQIGAALSLFEIHHSHEIALIELAASKKGELASLVKMVEPDQALIAELDHSHPYLFDSSQFLKEDYHAFFEQVPQIKVQTPSIEVTKLPKHPFLAKLTKRAKAAACALGVPEATVRSTIEHYDFQWRGSEIWRSPGGALFINEPYTAIPETLYTSLAHFFKLGVQGRRWLVFSGFQSETPNWKHAAQVLSSFAIDCVIAVQSHLPPEFFQYMKNLSPQTSLRTVSDMQEALHLLEEEVSSKDSVLFRGANKLALHTFIKNAPLFLHESILEINLGSIKQNIDLMRSHLGKRVEIMPMIKSDAYGTDASILARFLAGCGIRIFGVAYIQEALALRREGLQTRIFVLHARPSEVGAIVRAGLEVGVGSLHLAQSLQKEAQRRRQRAKVHLHLDTGMTRLGNSPDKIIELARYVNQSSHLELEGIMTHFALADQKEGDFFTEQQAAQLKSVASLLKREGIAVRHTHAQNSAAVARFGSSDFSMVRVGLALFGLVHSPQLPLKPALSLRSSITAIHNCKRGDTVSYGRCYQVNQPEERIAVVPLGYFDGIHRHYAQGGSLLIQGKKAPVVGSICMDFLMVNISSIPEAKEGDEVVIFGSSSDGKELPPEEFAHKGGTIPHELITCLGPRIQRLFTLDEHIHPLPQASYTPQEAYHE